MGQPNTAAIPVGGRLGARARFGFGIGDFGLNLYWQGLGLFLIYFQTDILGIPAVWAGACYLLASIWDGLTDPLMGFAADRVRTRWGKYRPFLLFGSVPLALGFALIFSAPDLPLAWLIGYTLATQLLVRVLYNAVGIPYSSLSVAITRDSAERTRLTGLRMQCAFLGGITVAYLMPVLAVWFGGADLRAGYGLAAIAIGAIATLSFLVCFFSVQESIAPPSASRAPPLLADARAFLLVARRSGPLLRLILGKCFVTFTITMHGRNLVYYFKYVLDSVDAVRYALPLLTAASFLSAPLWVWVIRRSSKRHAWFLGSVFTAAFGLVLQFPVHLPLPAAIALLAAVAASTTAYAICFWSMLPDTVEYNEWHFGRRDEAKVFGFASLTQKIAMGLSAAIAGAYLDQSGFVANQVQDARSIDAIRTTIGLVPAIGAMLSWWFMRNYPLDETAHRRIVESLAQRSEEHPGEPVQPLATRASS
jgi:glycoside/pentoside/hexuronide:cation symporter, GPH family